MPTSHPIYTIGHSNCDVPKIIDLLKTYKVEVLVDVRTLPYSRHAPQFNQKRIGEPLDAVGIRYEYLGNFLGGRPKDSSVYKSGVVPTDWKNLLLEIDYPAVMKKDFFHEGIQKLIAESKDKVVAIMCAEEDPAYCHRHHLIGRYLTENGHEVLHIRGDGTTQKDKDLSLEPGKKR
jgi:uncharacterized protein (DUF488 family)